MRSYNVFDSLIENDKEGLGKFLSGIVQVKEYLELLKDPDRDALELATADLFKEIRKDYLITHLYFIDSSGSVLLRAHNPGKFGDVLKRITYLGAESTD